MEKWAGKIADALVSNELIAEEKLARVRVEEANNANFPWCSFIMHQPKRPKHEKAEEK